MSFSIRQAAGSDAGIIVAHRRAMFVEMGYRDEAALDGMAAAFLPWVRSKMEDCEYFTWFAVDSEDQVVAGAGLWLMDWPPHMIGPGARRANILNVYTERRARRQGLARRLMQVAMDYCGEHGIRAIILHASSEGRPLYEDLGFKATNEMRVVLPASVAPQTV